MPNIFHSLATELENDSSAVFITILSTRGSAPQVPGSSAVFSGGALKAGTLGGGIMEGEATQRSRESLGKNSSFVYEYSLNRDYSAPEGAICGGTVYLLFDANPSKNKTAFQQLEKSLGTGKNGLLLTLIQGQDNAVIKRTWVENGSDIPANFEKYSSEISSCFENGTCLYINTSKNESLFLQPLYPLPKLIIAGAGHIGRALASMAKLLDFEITVIDNRPEYANKDNIPDADHIMAEEIGPAIKRTVPGNDTYIVIVTRGHRDDAEALKACIKAEVPYIGMIGSRRKVKLMRENFIKEGWATSAQFDRVHAPVGIDINSVTVPEIALSICAQLVQVRNRDRKKLKSFPVDAVILAAGMSSRMGVPKMLLPFGDKSIIEEVVSQAVNSKIGRIIVVTGADEEPVRKLLADYPVEIIVNTQFEKGMLSSVQCGIKALSPVNEGIMVLLGDQPMIRQSVINRILDAWENSGKGLVVASYNSKRGHPLVVGKKYLEELAGFNHDMSLKGLLLKYPGDVDEIETGSPEILRDIDTYQEYMDELKNRNNYD